jgi:hypothetical protein
LKVTQFKEEAQQLGVSVEVVRGRFEEDLDKGLILGIIVPNKTEAICFDSFELEGLAGELSSGRISLANLAEQFHLSVYQVHLVVAFLLKTKRIDGTLTYSTFIDKVTLQKALNWKKPKNTNVTIGSK